MAHYAFLDQNNMVTHVIAGRDEDEIIQGITDWESHYSGIAKQRCLRTSYNTAGNQHLNGGEPFRGNMAGIGYTYDEQLNAFIPPQPFESWVLNEETFLWDPPVPLPVIGGRYWWDEESQTWVEVEDEAV
jgi:hypothetical protein